VQSSQICHLEVFDENELNDNVEGGRKRGEEEDEDSHQGG